jgi:integrase
MPKIIKKLTYKEIDEALKADKPYKLCDEGGLRLLVRPTGTKVWQVPYVFNGKPNTYTIGHYSNTGRVGTYRLSEARKARDEVKALVAEGKDPKLLQTDECAVASFAMVAREWHGKGAWVKKHAKNILSSLEVNVFPYIGEKPIDKITSQDIVKILEKIEQRGALDVAHRICQRCWAVFDYAQHKGICETNPALGRSKFIEKRKPKHRPHLGEGQLSDFIKALEQYHGRDYIKLGVQILLRTLVRPGELRNATWDEFDFEKKQWAIPAERMKMRKPHIVPLSTQVVELLENLNKITGYSDYLFPSVITPAKPISDVTMNKVLQILNFKDKDGDVVVPHGFRHTASTILNENRFNSDVIERQLAHKDKDKVRSVYNHAEYLQERVDMMQWYSDHLDILSNN